MFAVLDTKLTKQKSQKKGQTKTACAKTSSVMGFWGNVLKATRVYPFFSTYGTKVIDKSNQLLQKQKKGKRNLPSKRKMKKKN